ncbi:3-deoxy-manno-octulosonate cytidylyltransferase [Mangrovibacterium lignilyticum]|uniref:3-deoxy-manno-octulosonate cytidylyltransferase n=1 Tax=Mangrovibacterium lignilyticum TaxID=2668052 RepID=UPI0013D1D765|nr:3-deoxy-manno-octulosonate cytidylyltransferase [Mangrovibacterium lignilyticum]
MKIIGVIPARYKSSRFPGKPLALILEKPMIIWVCEIVEKALGRENTFIATDDERIRGLVSEYGYNVIMTSSHCLTGTDRIWEVAQKIEADIYINIQGDEPLLDPNEIVHFIEMKKKHADYVINGMVKISDSEDPNNINLPKVLTNKNNDLIYMSRLPIPGVKANGKPVYYKQVCIYAFSFNELKAFGTQGKKADYEKFEDIEILRFFDLGIKIKMVETQSSSLAVDIPKDVIAVEKALTDKN